MNRPKQMAVTMMTSVALDCRACISFMRYLFVWTSGQCLSVNDGSAMGILVDFHDLLLLTQRLFKTTCDDGLEVFTFQQEQPGLMIL